MPLSVTRSVVGSLHVLAVAGELDISTAPRLRRALVEELSTAPAALVLDLQDLRFMDSSGLSVVVAGLKRARAQGARYGVARLQPVVARLFGVTHADRLMPVLDDLAEPPDAEPPDMAPVA